MSHSGPSRLGIRSIRWLFRVLRIVVLCFAALGPGAPPPPPAPRRQQEVQETGEHAEDES